MDNPYAPNPPLPPPLPTFRKWRIDRIILKAEKEWQELLDSMSTAEVEGWDVDGIHFHDVKPPNQPETFLMSILVLSREEIKPGWSKEKS